MEKISNVTLLSFIPCHSNQIAPSRCLLSHVGHRNVWNNKFPTFSIAWTWFNSMDGVELFLHCGTSRKRRVDTTHGTYWMWMCVAAVARRLKFKMENDEALMHSTFIFTVEWITENLIIIPFIFPYADARPKSYIIIFRLLFYINAYFTLDNLYIFFKE